MHTLSYTHTYTHRPELHEYLGHDQLDGYLQDEQEQSDEGDPSHLSVRQIGKHGHVHGSYEQEGQEDEGLQGEGGEGEGGRGGRERIRASQSSFCEEQLGNTRTAKEQMVMVVLKQRQEMFLPNQWE